MIKLSEIILYSKVARAHALVMSIAPVIGCYLYCRSRSDLINTKAFIFVALSIILFHLSVNTISEYRDCKTGLDEGNINGPPYRLVTGIVDSRHVLNIGIVSFVVGAIFGSIAVLLSNTMLLIPGFIGAGLALFYSEWPIGYKYKALGELGVFLAYGPLLVISCIYSLTNTISIPDILISVPMGLIIMSVVLANNIRDYEFDRVKTKTLPVIIGKTASTQILKAAIHVSFVTIGFLISEGIIKFQAIIIFTIYPIIIIVIRNMQPHQYISILGIASILYSIVISFH